MDKTDILVVDLEGTLTDCSHRMHFWKSKDYDSWNNLFYLDTPNVSLMESLKETGNAIVICTAKSEIFKAEVISWLKYYNFYDCVKTMQFRGEGDQRPSIAVKLDMLHSLSQRYNILKCFDDRPDICDAYKKAGYAVELVQAAITSGVPGVLVSAAETFKEKELEYGSAYLRHGKIMAEFFPNGITLKTPKDFLNFNIFETDVAKSNRLASAFAKGKNHQDSWRDKIVYAAIGESLIEGGNDV